MSRHVSEYLSPIEAKTTADLIIERLRDLIHRGVLKPGDRLPSEQQLQERFQVNRNQVREALWKLEAFGILKRVPQSGTYVRGIGVKAIEGILSQILALTPPDFSSLDDTRTTLEIRSAELAAKNADDEEIERIRKAHREFETVVAGGARGLDEDVTFHLEIAHASHSSVLISFLNMVTPDSLEISQRIGTTEWNWKRSLAEHVGILEAIEKRDPDAAAAAMKRHLTISRRVKEQYLESHGLEPWPRDKRSEE